MKKIKLQMRQLYLSIEIEKSNSSGLVPENIDINVLYDDEYVIALDKPSGIVMHPGVKYESGTLANGLLYHFKNLSNTNLFYISYFICKEIQ